MSKATYDCQIQAVRVYFRRWPGAKGDFAIKQSPRLPLTDPERGALRQAGIRLGMLTEYVVQSLYRETGWKKERCQYLLSLSQFQSLGSVGPSLAQDLWDLGFRSISDLKGANPTEMYERFSKISGHRADPCVEDVFRCAVAQAQDPELPDELRQWWMWKEQRGTPRVA